ncbi:MAG: hypothetical protein LC687_04925 [Actinobacteria bacterium]|nr:hypothetical protein [Actinomycetota bacterium]
MYDPRFNEFSFERDNRNDINDPKSYMKLLLGHHTVDVTAEAAEDIYNVVKDMGISDNTTISLPIRGQVHVITKDQLTRLQTKLEDMFGD